MPNNEPSDSLVLRLDALLSLLVEWAPGPEGVTQRTAEEQTLRLARVGLRPIEIAGITGRALSNITRDLAKARKSGGGKRRGRGAPTRK